jgi:hypothetical protein
MTLLKPAKDSKFPQNLRGLLNASQFDFRAPHITTLQYMGIADDGRSIIGY